MPKILIVEDDLAVSDLLKHVLGREGMDVVAVEDGEEALRRLRSEHIFRTFPPFSAASQQSSGFSRSYSSCSLSAHFYVSAWTLTIGIMYRNRRWVRRTGKGEK